jgi:type I restriction enzyme S subunit
MNLPYLSLEHIESVTGRIAQRPDATPTVEGKSTSFYFGTQHVLYGKLRPYLNKVALPDFVGRCTTELIPLLPELGVDRGFLAWLLRRPATVDAAMRSTTGARMPRADLRRVLAITVAIPRNLELQVELANQLQQRMDRVIAAKELCQRNMELIDRLAERLLLEFSEKDATQFVGEDR